jgi:hypothetical protein
VRVTLTSAERLRGKTTGAASAPTPTAPYERRDDFVRKRIPGADTVDLAAYFDRWPG